MFDFKVTLLSQPSERILLGFIEHAIHQGDRIMSVIADFVAQQNAYNDQMDAAIAGLTEDVKGLAAHVAALQNTPTPLSADDVGLLSALATRTKGIADKLAALDAVTPPVAPATPPEAVVPAPPVVAPAPDDVAPPPVPQEAAPDSPQAPTTSSPSGDTGTVTVGSQPPTP